MATGVDSYVGFQNITDIQAVKNAGVKFAYTKATDGTRLAPNGRADHHVNLYRSVDIPCGLYHYAQPGDPVAQAEVFVGEVQRLNAVQVPPALDMEEPGINSKREWSMRFHDHVAFRLGNEVTQAWYGSASWAAAIRPDTFNRRVVCWIAAYGRNDGKQYPNAITQAGYTGRVDIHQYTSSGFVPGIQSQGLDLNESPLSFGGGKPVTPDDINKLVEWLFWGARFDGNHNLAQFLKDDVRGGITALSDRVAALEAKAGSSPVNGPVTFDVSGSLNATPKAGA